MATMIDANLIIHDQIHARQAFDHSFRSYRHTTPIALGKTSHHPAQPCSPYQFKRAVSISQSLKLPDLLHRWAASFYFRSGPELSFLSAIS